jgi:hypothetical protein
MAWRSTRRFRTRRRILNSTQVLALGLPERETVEATIVQARNATCQAILSLTLAARRSLGAPFARGCDGETVAIMAERDDDDWESEWAGDRADEWELARDGEVRAEFRDSEVVEALGEAPPKFWVADVSWRSRHVSRPVWKSTSASGASWLRRAVRNEQQHAIEQASRRWRGGRHEDSANAP